MVGLPDDVRSLFEGRNYAHLATVLPSGDPHTVPVWVGVEDGRVVFFTQEQSRKARNLARDPRVAVSIVDFEHPYRSAWIRGRVAATRTGDEALAVIDRLSEKYTGRPFPMRSGIVFEIEAERTGFMDLPFRDERRDA
jgi:PPOX class probable F420-dependent enzyme